MLYKNVASQKLAVYAHDTSADAAKTGDASNITAQISIDGGATAATNDTNPTELDATDAPGVYIFDLTQAETNGDLIILAAVSSTSDVQIEPVFAYTAGVDLTYISGDSTAADNLEATYDGTGYSDEFAPATQSQVESIGSLGGILNSVAASFTLTTGTVASGSYTDTAAEDGTYHQIQDDSGTLDCYYEFDLGSTGKGAGCTIIGRVNGANDDLTLYAYDWSSSTWDVIRSYDGKNGSADQNRTAILLSKHTGTGANLGKVRIRFYGTGLTSANLRVDQLYVTYGVVQSAVGYAEGAIWVDTNASNTNTVVGTDGVADNPVSTWAAALTLSSAMGINKFHIANGSSITLTANSDNYEMYGHGWTLALGGQSIAGASISGATVTGTASGASQPSFEQCYIGAATIPPAVFSQCGFGYSSGAFTAASSGQYILEHCFSMVPGSGTPHFDFSGTGSSTGINARAWTGGANYTLDSDCTVSHEVLAGGGQTFTTGGADVELRGRCRSVTLTLSGAGTVQAIVNTGPISISGTATSTVNLYGTWASLADTSSGTTVTAVPSEVNSTYIEGQELSSKTGDNFDTFFNNAGAATGKTVDQVGSTAIRTGTAQAGAATSITLDASASATDNLYLDTVIIITGGTGAGQVNSITAYDGSTKVATVLKTWEVTPDATSTFELKPAASMIRYIMAMASGKLAFSGNVVSVYDQDGTTLLYTNTWSSTGRTRS